MGNFQHKYYQAISFDVIQSACFFSIRAGANAIVGIRDDTSEMEIAATEILCYGTAVKEPIK